MSPVAVVPGATVDVKFTVGVDRDTSIAEADLLVARDDNEDRNPDGDPAYERVITDIVAPGSNSFLFMTQVLADLNLLTDGFGRFLIGISVRTYADKTTTAYALGTVTVDSTRPTMSGLRTGLLLLLQHFR
jgi:hypothetical protein